MEDPEDVKDIFRLYKDYLTKQKENSNLAVRSNALSSKEQLDFDIKQAQFYEDFMTNPEEFNCKQQAEIDRIRQEKGDDYVDSILYRPEHHPLRRHRRFDFRLDYNELKVLQQYGFAVSRRLRAESFAEIYYRTYTDDLPVFVTTDSILHAWHHSFDKILEGLEENQFIPALRHLLGCIHGAIVTAKDSCSDHTTLYDADYFIGVARSLLDDTTIPCVLENDKLTTTLHHIKSSTTQTVNLFGVERAIDFSQFKPRGHYAGSAKLEGYFKAMMWLGRIDFLIAGKDSSLAQLSSCLVLLHLLKATNQFALWKDFDSVLRMFVGVPDSMNFEQLQLAVDACGIEDLLNVCEDSLASLQQEIVSKGYGFQLINKDIVESPVGKALVELAHAFSFVGQRFTVDAFAMIKVVYDNVIHGNQKAQRRIPSGLDVAYMVFGNDATKDEIERRINDQNGVLFRDGIPYIANLMAVRETLDHLSEKYWKQSLYTLWIDALRSLSPTEVNNHNVNVSTFNSKAWAMRNLNTQLASWTQLKHDTVLYAKQGYGCMTMCEYPDGLVDPFPAFWKKMKEMAIRASDILSQSDIFNYGNEEKNVFSWNSSYRGKDSYVNFYKTFSAVMEMLEQISTKQSSNVELDDKEVHFLKRVMEERRGSGATRYLGWYPSLFFAGREESGSADHIVADVFTDPADAVSGDPGCVLHEGVGDVYTAFIALNRQGSAKPTMYAGPVFSYFEFKTPINQRLNDGEWKKMIQGDDCPKHPEWASSTYLCL